MKEYCPN